MNLYIRQARESIPTPFILLDNKMSGFSNFTDTDNMPVIVKPGYHFVNTSAIGIRVFDEQGMDVTTHYEDTYTKINGAFCQAGDSVSRLILRRKARATHGKIFVYAWVMLNSPYKFSPDEEARAAQFEDLALKYKPAPKKIEPLLPTREAERLASLFSFLDDKNKILRDAGFILPEEE